MEQTILTNMCMIYDGEGNALVQNRLNKNWPGIVFPGGHVEIGESIIESTIREIKEETNLDIQDLRICGVKDWYNKEKNERYIVFLFKTNNYSGNLKSSNEGEVFWINLKNIKDYPLANGFDHMLEIFLRDELNELFYYFDQNQWLYKSL